MFSVEVFEFHGQPINEEDREKAKILLNDAMDTIEEELGQCNQDNALEFQARLKEMVESEIQKFPISKEFAFNSEGGLKSIIDQLGGSLTLCVEDDKLVGYIAVEM